MHRICLTVLRTSFVLFKCAIFASTQCPDISGSTRIVVHELRSVILDCLCESSELKGSWSYCNSIIFVGTRLQNIERWGKFTLLANYSFSIESVELNFEGLYRCRCGNTYQNYTYYLEISETVKPQFYIDVNGTSFTSSSNLMFEADVSEPVFLACHADGAKPAVNLTWKVNNEEVDPPVVVNVSPNPTENRLYDSVAVLRRYFNKATENISCERSAQHISSEQEIILQISTYVIPTVFISANGEHGLDFTFVDLHEDVILACKAKRARPSVNLTWSITSNDNDSLCISNFTVLPRDNDTFDSVALVLIKPSAVGTHLTCKVSGDQPTINRHINVSVYFYVTPHLSLSVNGSYHSTNLYAGAGRDVPITCVAARGRPAANLSLYLNSRSIPTGEMSLSLTEANETFDVQSSLSVTFDEDRVNVTCVIEGYQGVMEQFVSALVKTYVIPIVSVTINGKQISNGTAYYATSHDEINVTCNARGARPPSSLTWFLIETGKVRLEKGNFSASKGSINRTFDSSTSLKLKLDKSIIGIYCINIGQDRVYTQNFSVEIVTPDIPSGFVRDLVFVIAACLLGLMLIIYFVVKFSVGTFNFKSRKKNFPVVPLAERQTTNTVQSRESNMSSGISEDVTSPPSTTPSIMTVAAELHQEHDRRPPAMDLPSLPESSPSSSYSIVSSEECIYYSETNDTSRNGHVFQQQDVSLITKLTSGILYNRWMGTLETGNNQTNYVVVTTISDKTIQERKFHWNDFVKRVLELPQSEYIIKTEGIYIDAGHLYMVQEHIHCQTLEAYQTSRRQIPNSKYGTTSFSESDSMRLILEILNGMELIQSYGFLHPGLSTSKILLKGRGKCKLYDICLTVDATNKVMCIKSKMDCSLNELPLESMFRNEYTHESDIWSTAVVIWKILSSGSSPFAQFQCSQSENLAEVSRAWPDQAARIRNNLLFECWNKLTSLRPTISQLKSTFEEVWESLPKDTATSQTTSEDYMPMVGKVDGETEYSREILKTN